ncbi:MAG: hypothetical protein Q4A55_00820 [Aerococcus sp.]|nr:hypothetical protein [Aerococcus sp.]
MADRIPGNGDHSGTRFSDLLLRMPNKKTEKPSEATPKLAEKISLKDSLARIVKDKNILLLYVAGFFATGTTWGVINRTNLYMTNNVGVSSVFASSIMSIYGIAALISKPVGGLLI